MNFKEVRMEVVSLEEAIEFCNAHGLDFDHIYNGQGSNSGKLMMLAWKKEYFDYEGYDFEKVPIKPVKVNKENYIVGTMINGGLLVVTKSGVSFDRSEAKHFSKDKADKEAIWRTRNSKSGYSWYTIKI